MVSAHDHLLHGKGPFQPPKRSEVEDLRRQVEELTDDLRAAEEQGSIYRQERDEAREQVRIVRLANRVLRSAVESLF